MNNTWNDFPNETNSSVDSSGMKSALSAIVKELQSFSTSQDIEIFGAPREVKSDEIFEKLNMVKSKLSSKNKKMKKLRKKFKTAYFVARSVMSAKEDENAYLLKYIKQYRDQCECLLQKNRVSSRVIEDLKSESQIIKDEMESLMFLLNAGYNELQKMRNMPLENISAIEKLKAIMISCGQYYSEFFNEHEIRLQLEQKNRYLASKITSLTNSMKAMSAELNTLKKQENNGTPLLNVQKAKYCSSFDTCGNETSSKSSSDDRKPKKPLNLDFSSHLTTVKRLLDDQDDMLRSLKKISKELTIHQHY